MILFFGSMAIASLNAFRHATGNVSQQAADMVFFIVFATIAVFLIVAVFVDRKYRNPFARPWLHRIYKLDKNRIAFVTPGGTQTERDWSSLEIIVHYPYFGHCLIFESKEKFFVGRLVGRDLEVTGPLAKAIRDAVRNHGKGDLLIPLENWEHNNISGYNQIPRRRLFLYAQTPAFTLFLIGAATWMFDGATPAFYNYMMYGVLSMPVMAVLVRIYSERTTKAVARFQEQLDEDKAGSTSLSEEK